MRIERTKNATRNVVFGFLTNLIALVIPFFMRTAKLQWLGVEYLGLGGLFTSVMRVLNLAELGVGSAMVYTMYRSIANDDEDEICALMRLYRLYYRVIGLGVALCGLALLPFLPRFISGSVPDGINLYSIYLLELSMTVCSYWLFSYKNSLLTAFQREDIKSKIAIIVNIVTSVLQLAVLYWFRNYYLYLVVGIVLQIASNITTAIIVTKRYPRYQPRGGLDVSVKKRLHERIRDLFFSKIAGTIVSSSDTLVISAFLGLVQLAIYQNYFYIMNSVMSFLTIILTSSAAGIGNSLVTETPEKNYHDFCRLSFLMLWILTVCVSCFACMYQPFITLWMGEKYLLSTGMVTLFCAYFYVYMVQLIGCRYKDSGGLWREDRMRTFLTAIANLILNIAFVRIWGLYAIILSTIASYLFLGTPWLIHNLFSLLFHRSSGEYVRMLLKNTMVTAAAALFCYFICGFIPFGGFLQVAACAVVCIVVSNAILYFVYRKNRYFAESLDLCKRIIKRSL